MVFYHAKTSPHRCTLTGGGILRSVGGWVALKGFREAGIRVKGDERILGDSDFVIQVLKVGWYEKGTG